MISAKSKVTHNRAGNVIVNSALAQTVLRIVDRGLSYGTHNYQSGNVCVEVAVSIASGEEETDNPSCVDSDLSQIKIELNDKLGWFSEKARAKGLRRIAIAQLGSIGRFKYDKFWNHVEAQALTIVKAHIYRQTDKAKSFDELRYPIPKKVYNVLSLIDFFKIIGVPERESLPQIAEIFVQALIAQKIPGTKFLYLTKRKPKTKVRVKAKAKKLR